MLKNFAFLCSLLLFNNFLFAEELDFEEISNELNEATNELKEELVSLGESSLSEAVIVDGALDNILDTIQYLVNSVENKNINLKPNDVLLNFIQRLRDEAHRFAITAHRSRRSKSTIRSVFDEIKGIGPKRKKDLLLYFGTIKKIKSASLEELKKIKTIPIKKLEELYEFFNS